MRRSLVVLLLALPTCTPEFGDRDSLVTSTRVLAVAADPPEARPNDATVAYRVLVASPDGTVADAPESFALCATPKLLTENASVSAACLGGGAAVRPMSGDRAPVPADACSLFGPETPPGGYRARDPDVTGGYFQPVRVTVGSPGAPIVAFGFERILCHLSSAPLDAARAYEGGYRPNLAPAMLPLEARVDGALVALDAIPRGRSVVLRTSWPPESAESYLAFDAATQSVVTRRESLRVSWFATAGTFAEDVTGRAADDPATFSDDTWTAPEQAGTVHLWRVLRDARGAVTWSEETLAVR
jgi:hypothetical protein